MKEKTLKWLLACLVVFNVLDLLLTWIGFSIIGSSGELNPLARMLIDSYGFGSLIFLKGLVVFGLVYYYLNLFSFEKYQSKVGYVTVTLTIFYGLVVAFNIWQVGGLM